MSDLVPSEQDYADAREHLIDILVAAQSTTVPSPRVPTVRGPRFREAVAQAYAREIDALCESAWQPAEMDALNQDGRPADTHRQRAQRRSTAARALLGPGTTCRSWPRDSRPSTMRGSDDAG